MRRICPILILLALVLNNTICRGQESFNKTIAFWNCENYFDTQHDTLKDDYAFTPSGDNHWTPKRYADKRNKIYKIIAAMKWPVAVGLAEVENDRVLRDLCLGTPLRKKGYNFVHFESPNPRGADCALLYREKIFHLLETKQISVSDSDAEFYTRDILMVGGILDNDTCYLLVNHWPSKLGGAFADQQRLAIAYRLRYLMDSLQRSHPDALILAMGDFNASPEEEAISKGLGFGRSNRNSSGFYNLMASLPKGTGSYKYQDSWSYIDQFISNRELPVEIFSPDFMLSDDPKHLGKKPFRTYLGMRYLGGYSDHLPIIATLP